MGGPGGEECFWNEAQAFWNKQPFSGNEEPISRNQPHIAEAIVTVRNTFRRLATGFPRRSPRRQYTATVDLPRLGSNRHSMY